MKRNPRKVRWTKAFRKASGKEMAVDSTFEFEKRRNVPVRYDRDLISSTVQAMRRIEEVRLRRDRLHYRQRASIKAKTAMEDREIEKLVSDNKHLIESEQNTNVIIKRQETVQKAITRRPLDRKSLLALQKQRKTTSSSIKNEIKEDRMQIDA